jgi:cyclopropane-fatty-acyl-phospholipid synthase
MTDSNASPSVADWPAHPHAHGHAHAHAHAHARDHAHARAEAPGGLDSARQKPAVASRLDRFLQGRLIQALQHLKYGRLILQDGDEHIEFGSAGEEHFEFGSAGEEHFEFGSAGAGHLDAVTVKVLNSDFYQAITLRGSVGAAEAYMDGSWTCSDLTGLVRLLVRNRDTLDGMETGAARIGGWLLRVWHALKRNSRTGSRRNIAAHYDLGNEFFKLFLSPDLMYSSAVWKDGDTLSEASTRKLELICEKLALTEGDQVVEIGSGWGGFACHAARQHGCHVTTITISREQFRYVLARIKSEGLEDKVTVLLRDYRELEGQYDKLVSIEMIEAVGAQYLDGYFEKVGHLLKPGGKALIQAITIEDHRYAQALRSVDFIKRYIFPGSFIPSINAMLGAKSRATDLALIHLEDFGDSYARTLRAWRQRFMEQLPQVHVLGFDNRFIRMWEFYLAYCEGGFLETSIGVAHLLMAKPRHTGMSK